ncbi:MAG: peptidoglycan editing factor PgeF [Burkholderiales bacterium]|nr:peptidoglycan editing factor PgeF [Burkholderiales bacterium]
MIALTSPPWPPGWIKPSLGSRVHAVMTARSALSAGQGAGSGEPYDDFNLGNHVGDDPGDVARHRRDLALAMGAEPVWLQQVHGNRVLRLSRDDVGRADEHQADGSLTTESGVACVIMVADCLPVLLAAPQGRAVAALHAGWRGLAGAGDMQGRGIVETGVAALCEAASCDPAEVLAWLGPCIGPTAFEVGADVLRGFGVNPGRPHPRFRSQPFGAAPDDVTARRWLADLPGLATDRLRALGLGRIEGGTWCTVSEPSRFFSFRRDGVTGRQAACIWLGER